MTPLNVFKMGNSSQKATSYQLVVVNGQLPKSYHGYFFTTLLKTDELFPLYGTYKLPKKKINLQ